MVLNLETGIWINHKGNLIRIGSEFTLFIEMGSIRISYSGKAPESDLLLPLMEDEVEIWVIGRERTLLAFGQGLWDGSWDVGSMAHIKGEVRSSGRWYGPALDDRWDHRR